MSRATEHCEMEGRYNGEICDFLCKITGAHKPKWKHGKAIDTGSQREDDEFLTRRNHIYITSCSSCRSCCASFPHLNLEFNVPYNYFHRIVRSIRDKERVHIFVLFCS